MSAWAVDVSNITIELFGGTLPDKLNGGIGNVSAMRGSNELIVNIPRPTEHARILFYTNIHFTMNKLNIITVYIKPTVSSAIDVCDQVQIPQVLSLL